MYLAQNNSKSRAVPARSRVVKAAVPVLFAVVALLLSAAENHAEEIRAMPVQSHRYSFGMYLGGYRYPFSYRYYSFQPRRYPFGVGPYTGNYGGFSGNAFAPPVYGPRVYGDPEANPFPPVWADSLGFDAGYGYSYRQALGYGGPDAGDR